LENSCLVSNDQVNVALHNKYVSVCIMSDSLPALPNHLLFEAIALKKTVAATYNKLRVRLAPYILYTKHDEIYVDAVTVEREGLTPREVKLGSFKVAGLKELASDGQPFQPENLFDPTDEKYAGVTLFAVER
jgi:hypothetical protein